MKFPKIEKEDNGKWEEIPRTDEIKQYSRGIFGLIRRTLIGQLFAGVAAGFATWMLVKYIGIQGLGGNIAKSERRAFIDGILAVSVVITFFILPIPTNIYRPRTKRVSRKIKE